MKKRGYKVLFMMCLGTVMLVTAIEVPYQQNKVKYEIKKVNNNAFTFGEELNYRIHYGPLSGGTAHFQVESDPVKVNDRNAYHIKVKGKSAGMVDMMFKVHDEYESFLDQDAMIPWKAVKKVKEGGYTDSDFIIFDQQNGFATSRRGKVDIQQQTQDIVSAIYFARSTDMSNAKIGDIFPVNFYMDGENYLLRFKYSGREIIKTDAGTFKALVIKPQLIQGRVFKDEEALTLWVTDDENKLPLLVETDIFVGSIKAELVSYKNVKNPMTAKVK
ncbi:MAG: DUF3108 domain-containing protein [Bacteroidia bacterium]|nr:DUF3108 domain-containing protein [Bacteroidia bacterium]